MRRAIGNLHIFDDEWLAGFDQYGGFGHGEINLSFRSPCACQRAVLS
jgi:hypothetical protein